MKVAVDTTTACKAHRDLGKGFQSIREVQLRSDGSMESKEAAGLRRGRRRSEHP